MTKAAQEIEGLVIWSWKANLFIIANYINFLVNNSVHPFQKKTTEVKSYWDVSGGGHAEII